jgi:septal ring factor EnvC (AmiA/AmiB activator)
LKLSPLNINNTNSHYVIEEDKSHEQEQQRRRSRKSEEKQSNHNTLSSLIERTERHSKEFENEKGEISNIENIYKRVFGK